MADIPREIWTDEIFPRLGDYERSSLFFAAMHFRVLLAGTARPKKRCNYCCGNIAEAMLKNAVAAGHPSCVQAFSPVATQEWPVGLTLKAAKYGRTEVLRYLRYHDSPWSGKETHWAARKGHIETLRVLREELNCPE